MADLLNKRVLLGVTGGIAAYKSADLVRRLKDAGAEVRVVMTAAAEAFITPLTMQAVSGRPVYRRLLDAEAESGMGHIELARWADVVLLAPASADTIAHIAHGFADDLLTTICLVTRAPLTLAPAMNQQMWLNPATQANITTLRERGALLFGPALGDQACGETGPGRMLEPLELVARLPEAFAGQALLGRRVLITAGPTWEALDPVRGFSNLSSGKMGYAVARAAREAGADVTLVSGPVNIPLPDGVAPVRVTSAVEMHQAVLARLDGAQPAIDVFIGVAAVADYRPNATSTEKLKKQAEPLTIELVPNPDILAAVASHRARPFTVGFAAETGNIEHYAREKLVRKGVDLMVANTVGPGTGIAVDDNELLLVDRAGVTKLPRAPKEQLARSLIKHLADRLNAKSPGQNTRRAHH